MLRCGYILILFFLVGCSSKVSKKNLEFLNGYWEITAVEFSNGQKKTYNVNPSVDYIKLDKLKGFKKKVQPKFDGSYVISNDTEFFTIFEKDGSLIISFENDLSSWEEQIITLEEDFFSIVNQDNITYSYKRYEPINIQN